MLVDFSTLLGVCPSQTDRLHNAPRHDPLRLPPSTETCNSAAGPRLSTAYSSVLAVSYHFTSTSEYAPCSYAKLKPSSYN